MIGTITSLLGLIATLVPSIGGNVTLIGTVVGALTEIVPVVIKEVNDVTPMVKNIIAALSENPAATEEQLAALQALDAKCDADFEDAAAAAEAEDKA